MSSLKIIVITVVLYNKECSQSLTLKSLRNTLVKLPINNDFEFMIRIVNNGPEMIRENYNCGAVSVLFSHSTYNASLSSIYNNTIDQYAADYYIFLDDDTQLNVDYFNSFYQLEKKDSLVFIPQISTPKGVVYPIFKPSVLKGVRLIRLQTKVYSIASGLIISRRLVSSFKSIYYNVFDERFFLYGVDSTFFKRLYKLRDSIMGGSIGLMDPIEHSLSSQSTEVSRFRVLERASDMALQLRYYFSFKQLIRSILDLAKCTFSKHGFAASLLFFKTLVTGQHYRSNLNAVNNK